MEEVPVTTKPVPKKKPGRPRKKPLKPTLKRTGISDTPINNNNCVEMVYDMPFIFKKVFGLLRSMAVKNVCMEFNKECVNIITTDHLEKSHIKIAIHGDKVNHYYCAEPIKSYLNPKNLDKIIQVLDKNYLSVAIILKTVTNRSILSIIYKNELEIDEYREIELIRPNNSITDISFSFDDYPIKFVLPGKFFKKLIGDIGSFSDIFTINKVGTGPLTFLYTSKDNKIKSRHIVKSPESIKLVALVGKDDIFSSSIHIEYLKPLSSSLLSDHMLIAADTYRNMIFHVAVDNGAIEVYVNTTTVRLKGE
jgi:hypothetical protein